MTANAIGYGAAQTASSERRHEEDAGAAPAVLHAKAGAKRAFEIISAIPLAGMEYLCGLINRKLGSMIWNGFYHTRQGALDYQIAIQPAKEENAAEEIRGDIMDFSSL